MKRENQNPDNQFLREQKICYFHVIKLQHKMEDVETEMDFISNAALYVLYRTGAESERRRGADVVGVIHEGKLSGLCEAGQ